MRHDDIDRMTCEEMASELARLRSGMKVLRDSTKNMAAARPVTLLVPLSVSRALQGVLYDMDTYPDQDYLNEVQRGVQQGPFGLAYITATKVR